MFLNFRKHPRFHSLRSWTEVARHATRRFTVVRAVHSLMLLVVLVITVFRQARFGDDVSNESWTIITIFLVLRGYFATLALNARNKLSLCQNKFSFLSSRKNLYCYDTYEFFYFHNNLQLYFLLSSINENIKIRL